MKPSANLTLNLIAVAVMGSVVLDQNFAIAKGVKSFKTIFIPML